MQDIRLTPTSYIVLGLLRYVPDATPYDLKRLVNEGVRHVWALQHAQLYAEPARLARAGYLVEHCEAGGRRRKRYALTERGNEALDAWLSEPSWGATEIRDPALLQLFFGADPAVVAAAQLALHQRRARDFEAERDRRGGVLPPGVLLALRAGIGHEREYARFWSAVASEHAGAVARAAGPQNLTAG